jgi:glycosyltransferase involved in cell wall biosynthesis
VAASPSNDGATSAGPLVSVIIPAHNVAPYLAEAIDSVLAQSYPRVEIVVVDDGSTDDTPAVIAGYGTRIVAIRQDNQGPGAARNRAIDAASGDAFALLDADDVWFPTRLERMVGLLERSPDVELVTTDLYIIDGTEPTERLLFSQQRKRLFPSDPDRQIAEIACYNFIPNSVVFRRDLIERFGIYNEDMRVAEDYELWVRYLVGGIRAVHIDEPLGYYRIREGSYIRSGEPAERHLAVLEEYLPTLWKLGARGNARDAYTIGTRLAAEGDRRAALTFFLHALAGEGARASRLKYALSSARRLMWPTAPERSRIERGTSTVSSR